jgi:hypothetical protein
MMTGEALAERLERRCNKPSPISIGKMDIHKIDNVKITLMTALVFSGFPTKADPIGAPC